VGHKNQDVGIFPLFKKKQFFSHEEKQRIVHAIEAAERNTSGEIRVFVESRNAMVDPLERAAQVFLKLKMQHTKERNAVLLYIAIKDRELALFGDEGIHEKTFEGYWQNAVRSMIDHFKNENVVDGIVNCVTEIGKTLKDKFPYDEDTDKNELSNDIVFGR